MSSCCNCIWYSKSLFYIILKYNSRNSMSINSNLKRIVECFCCSTKISYCSITYLFSTTCSYCFSSTSTCEIKGNSCYRSYISIWQCIRSFLYYTTPIIFNIPCLTSDILRKNITNNSFTWSFCESNICINCSFVIWCRSSSCTLIVCRS